MDFVACEKFAKVFAGNERRVRKEEVGRARAKIKTLNLAIELHEINSEPCTTEFSAVKLFIHMLFAACARAQSLQCSETNCHRAMQCEAYFADALNSR